MKKGEKSTRTLHIERIAEFFLLQPKSVEKKLNEETKLSNIHIKKAFEYISNGLPYYDMNEILRQVSIEVAETTDDVLRFMLIWNINHEGKTRQWLDCFFNGKLYNTKTSGIEGINSILEQIGFEGKRLQEPKTFLELLVWKENI